MRTPLPAALLAWLAAAVPTQSPLTTTYAGGNGLVGGNVAVYFDLDVQVPVLVHRLDVNAIGGAGSSAIELWTCPLTWIGSDNNPAAWTLRGSSAVVAASPEGLPTLAPMLAAFALAAGPIGVAVVYNGSLGPSYTNGNGTNQTWATAEMTLQAGASGGIFTGAVNNPRVWNGSIHFTAAGGVVATRANYGTGCVGRAASLYEHFASAPSFDLSNGGLSLIPAAGGYTATTLQVQYLPPSSTALVLVLGDDTDTSVTLQAPLPFPGGTTTSLVVCSNGFVSAGSGNGQGFTPVPLAMLAMPRTVWSCWHDYNPSFPGSGQVKFEQSGGVARITWDGVLGYSGAVAGTQRSTFQFQFVLATGAVHYVFQTMDLIGGSAYGDAHVIGYSPAGASLDPGSANLSAVLPIGITLPASDELPLALAASARPIAGTTIGFHTTNIPPGSPLGAVVLGLTQHLPGIDLGSIGMPGCNRYTDGLVTMLFVAPGTAHSVAFPVPNVVGAMFQAQSLVYAPQANLTPLGAISSNGTALGIGNL